jgi:hypothetical protein
MNCSAVNSGTFAQYVTSIAVELVVDATMDPASSMALIESNIAMCVMANERS